MNPSFLAQGNRAFRDQDYRRAIACYQQALVESPWLAQTIQANLDLARKKLGQARRSSTGGYDVVMFWKQNDSTLYGRRIDMLAKYLAWRDDVRQVVVFDAPLSLTTLDKLREGHPLTQDRFIHDRTLEKVKGLRDTAKITYRVLTYDPAVYASCGRVGGKHKPLGPRFAEWVEHQLAKLSVEVQSSVFFLYPKNYCLPDVLDRLQPGKIVVDVVDDHRAWPGLSEQEKSRLTDHYQQLLTRADRVIANCEPVRQSMRLFAPDIRLIPNGCDPEPDLIEPVGDPMYLRVRDHPGHVIGYVGNLEAKIDIPLLERLADAFPDDLLVLAGSTHANPDVRALAQRRNVVMPGVLPYEQANAWIKCFAVGIIPHQPMALTDNMNPLKLYVYAAFGLPVVATAVKNLDLDYPRLNVTNTHESFIEAVRRARQQGQERDTDYLDRVSWTRRIEAMSPLFEPIPRPSES